MSLVKMIRSPSISVEMTPKQFRGESSKTVFFETTAEVTFDPYCIALAICAHVILFMDYRLCFILSIAIGSCQIPTSILVVCLALSGHYKATTTPDWTRSLSVVKHLRLLNNTFV